MAKKEKVNLVQKRRLELLKKYYPVDEEKKIITVKMFYEHASELLDYSVGEEGQEMFSEDFISKLTEIFSKIPFGYKVDVKLDIKDYDVYDEKTIMEKFNDFMELNSYDVIRYNKKNNLIAATLILVGITILIINAILSGFGIYGSEGQLEYDVIKEVFDITSWVFIWQAVTVLFLSPSDSKIYILTITGKINSLALIREGTETIVETREQILNACRIDTMTQKAKNYALLITSILLIFIGVINVLSPFVEYLKNAGTEEETVLVFSIDMIIDLSIGALLVLAGALGISKFSNKDLRLKWVFVVVFIILIMLILVVIAYVVLLIMEPSSTMVKYLISILIRTLTYLLYVVSYKAVERNQMGITKKSKKNKKEETEVQA